MIQPITRLHHFREKNKTITVAYRIIEKTNFVDVYYAATIFTHCKNKCWKKKNHIDTAINRLILRSLHFTTFTSNNVINELRRYIVKLGAFNKDRIDETSNLRIERLEKTHSYFNVCGSGVKQTQIQDNNTIIDYYTISNKRYALIIDNSNSQGNGDDEYINKGNGDDEYINKGNGDDEYSDDEYNDKGNSVKQLVNFFSVKSPIIVN